MSFSSTFILSKEGKHPFKAVARSSYGFKYPWTFRVFFPTSSVKRNPVCIPVCVCGGGARCPPVTAHTRRLEDNFRESSPLYGKFQGLNSNGQTFATSTFYPLSPLLSPRTVVLGKCFSLFLICKPYMLDVSFKHIHTSISGVVFLKQFCFVALAVERQGWS